MKSVSHIHVSLTMNLLCFFHRQVRVLLRFFASAVLCVKIHMLNFHVWTCFGAYLTLQSYFPLLLMHCWLFIYSWEISLFTLKVWIQGRSQKVEVKGKTKQCCWPMYWGIVCLLRKNQNTVFGFIVIIFGFKTSGLWWRASYGSRKHLDAEWHRFWWKLQSHKLNSLVAEKLLCSNMEPNSVIK